ncbi:gas vesicle protein [Janibacter cremeus]|uniref:gas vesicle protein GvpO n=1 Tax=Janibacter cremeus TaxID=1285192 RepID=UPI0023FA1AEC|nr:gas vesicle protein [Janibacter cremeus]WEV78836.1 gas vesicle protein [Janibacter cremeus]
MADQSEAAAQEDTDSTTSEDSTTPAKKSTAKKTTAKKSAPKKRAVSTKKSTSDDSDSRSSSGRGSRLNAVKIARSAKEQLAELLNKESETVIGVQRTDDGWEVDLEVVETRRIPDTTDVLAIYRVELDDDGEIEGYERLERYIRGKTEGGGTRG